jgi:BNR/Asp-box repeat.
MSTKLTVCARAAQTAWLIASVLTLAAFATTGYAAVPGTGPLPQDEAAEEELLQLDLSFTSRRTAGSTQIDITQAGELRGRAAVAAKKLRDQQIPSGTSTFGGAWTQIGPNPVVQGLRSPGAQRFGAMSGRIGALAIRPSNGQFILGAAQGGIWLYDAGTGTWSAKTTDQTTQAMGALAVAPSNDAIIYAGTGEGALSGDSYFGNGVFKSTDGGNTWAKISGDTYFNGVSMSRIVVDPANADHVYAAVLRGRGGARRVSPPDPTKFGIWESKDGGVNWALIQKVKDNFGATDLEMDPQNSLILYSSFWGDAIYKSIDGGKKWKPVMTGLPIADYAGAQTRFSIAISHPSPGGSGTLYAGFDWIDGAGHQPSRVFKSTDGAASWAILPAGSPEQESVEDYCATQCFYDNVIEVDPTNPNIVFARVSSTTTSARAASSAPTMAARRGSTSATTSIRTSTRSPSIRPTRRRC